MHLLLYTSTSINPNPSIIQCPYLFLAATAFALVCTAVSAAVDVLCWLKLMKAFDLMPFAVCTLKLLVL